MFNYLFQLLIIDDGQTMSIGLGHSVKNLILRAKEQARRETKSLSICNIRNDQRSMVY